MTHSADQEQLRRKLAHSDNEAHWNPTDKRPIKAK